MSIKGNTLYLDIAKYAKESRATALSFRSKKISYADFLSRVDIMAKKFSATGIIKDMVVTLISPNIPEAVISLYALNKIGAIISILHPGTPKATLLEHLAYTHSQVTIFFEGLYTNYQEIIETYPQQFIFLSAVNDLGLFEKGNYKNKYKDSLSKIKPACIFSSLDKLKTEEERSQFDINEDSSKLSIFLRNNLTIGKNKTIMLADRSLSFIASQASNIYSCDIKGLGVLGILPLFHSFGLVLGMHTALANKATLILNTTFDSNEITSLINKNSLHILLLNTYLLKKLLKDEKFNNANLKNLKSSLIDFERPSMQLVEKFNKLMKDHSSDNRLYEAYGLNETGSLVSVNTLADHKLSSVGKPLMNTKVKIVDPTNRKVELSYNETGEILVAGLNSCLGYYNQEKRKQPFFTDARRITYIGTGDLGYLDKDGFLYLSRKNRESIKIAGFNINPAYIEKLSCEVDGVIHAVALYIDGKHPYFHLYIENHSHEDAEIQNAVRTYLEARLLPYSMPEKITILPHFPRTSDGKVDRKALIHF